MSSSSSYQAGALSPRQVARQQKAAQRKALSEHVGQLTKLVSIGSRLAAAIYGSKEQVEVRYNYGGPQTEKLTKTSFNAFKKSFKAAVKSVVLEALALNKRKPRTVGSAGNFGQLKLQNQLLIQFFGSVNLGTEITTNPPGSIIFYKKSETSKGKWVLAEGAQFASTGRPLRDAIAFAQPGNPAYGVVSGGTITQLWHLYRIANGTTLSAYSSAMHFPVDVRRALKPLILKSIENDLAKLAKYNGSVSPAAQQMANFMAAKVDANPDIPQTEAAALQMIAQNSFPVNKASEKPVSFFNCDVFKFAQLSKLTSANPVPKAQSDAAVAAATANPVAVAAMNRQREAIISTSVFNRAEQDKGTAAKRKAAAALKPKKVRAKK